MADFTDILRKSPYRTLHDSIDNLPACELQAELAEFRQKEPEMTLTPLLSYCIQECKIMHFEALLNQGVDPDQYAVEAAADIDDDRFLLELLRRGWPIDSTLQGGKVASVLCLAVDRPELLEKLLELGANPNALSKSAETPLSAAVQTGTIDSIQRLLGAGADVQKGDPLHYAVERESHDLEIVRILLDHQAPVNTIQFADPSARQLRHSLVRGTPLHKACLLSKHEVAKLLLEHGANPNSTRRKDSQVEQTTPLDISTEKGDSRMVTLLNSFIASGNV